MTSKIKCRYCGSEKVVKRGFSHTQNRGRQQRYLCRGCGKSFIPDNGFWKMKNSEKIITMAVDMYLSSLSSRKMRNQLRRHFGIRVSHETILRWVYKYVQKVQKFLDRLCPRLSGKIYADETEIQRRKNWDVFWCAIDWDTRFVNATLYSPRPQNMKDAVEFLKKIKALSRPKYVQTDGHVIYPRAFRKVFWRTYGGTQKTEHRVVNYLRTKRHNYRIETFFSKLKDRVRNFRGLGSLWSAPILLNGIIIQHNFIEQHTTVKDCPCERAGLKLGLGENRWLGLIRLASV